MGESGAAAAKPPSSPVPHDRAEDERILRQKLGREGLNGHGYVPDANDVNIMARALYSEFGRVGNWEDMWAGAWSIVNRIRPNTRIPTHRGELGRSLTDVLMRRGRDGVPQYSFAPRGSIDGPGGSIQWRESANPARLPGDRQKAWQLAVLAAREVLGGGYADPTGGSIYFHNRSHGTFDTVGGFFRDARRGIRGRPPSITESPYRSPNVENFFYRDLSDPLRPILSKPRLAPSRRR